MKRKIAIAAIAASALVLGACASGAGSSGSDSAGGSKTEFVKKDPLVLGYSVYDQTDPYFIAYANGVKARAKEKGVKVVLSDSKDSAQIQVTGSAQLISQNISALLITPVQPDALPATVSAAHAAKIPVLVGDIGTKGDIDYFVQSNNEEGGAQAAEYLGKKFDDGKNHDIAFIRDDPGHPAGEARGKGFKDKLKEYPNLTLVSEIPGQTIEAAYKAGQDIFSANPNVEAIFGFNSNAVQGAVRAAETSKKSPAIVGFNGDPIELQLIEQGKQEATVAQDPFGQGQALVDAALALLDGETPKFTDEASKTLEQPTTLVTKDNLAEFQAKLADQ
ncbi:substrate-binding domain-containing protein [Aeromicrobium sp. CFBP 8757]|uniref:substrate-binding domain-containing protein n=1 Tax=Aeromicrobium sp. CFBP 8757 TaxID=2775288 RepID=UPI00178201DC|nr:substrate-binding domain-containing protein [Aeromicrobium sp. CFBP 8757]MBD8605392.1 substrate-binding domain-containing protein [Aeromicrobium sp. CFBP 8757]